MKGKERYVVVVPQMPMLYIVLKSLIFFLHLVEYDFNKNLAVDFAGVYCSTIFRRYALGSFLYNGRLAIPVC